MHVNFSKLQICHKTVRRLHYSNLNNRFTGMDRYNKAQASATTKSPRNSKAGVIVSNTSTPQKQQQDTAERKQHIEEKRSEPVKEKSDEKTIEPRPKKPDSRLESRESKYHSPDRAHEKRKQSEPKKSDHVTDSRESEQRPIDKRKQSEPKKSVHESDSRESEQRARSNEVAPNSKSEEPEEQSNNRVPERSESRASYTIIVAEKITVPNSATRKESSVPNVTRRDSKRKVGGSRKHVYVWYLFLAMHE